MLEKFIVGYQRGFLQIEFTPEKNKSQPRKYVMRPCGREGMFNDSVIKCMAF
jgi:hypothetical protein